MPPTAVKRYLQVWIVLSNFRDDTVVRLVHRVEVDFKESQFITKAQRENFLATAAHRFRREEFADGRINLLFVGRMEKRKGLRYLLSAYADLKWEYPELRLIVVGPGEPDDESQRVMGERNLADVVFTGRVSDDALPAYYQAADIFCSPATGGESFGMVLLEAMAAGVPTVATDISGYREVVTHGVDGLLSTPSDPMVLASAIRTLIEDPNLRTQMGSAGQIKAHGYRWSEVATRVLDFYKQTADRTELSSIV